MTPSPKTPPPGDRQLRLVALWVLLVACVTAVLAATLAPVPIDRGMRPAIDGFLERIHGLGVPDWFGYGDLEFAANIVVFVPLGLLVALLLPRRLVWLTVIIGPVVSIGVELAQATLLAERYASVADVVANSVGAAAGFGLAVAVRVLTERRDRARSSER